jgi:hopene-associated glycosyltransferase HpnB
MLEALTILTWVSACIWLVIAVLPWRPWAVREVLSEPDAVPAAHDFSDLTIVIPARNEAEHIGMTLMSLAAQGGAPKIILIDDHSDDGTVHSASSVSKLDLQILRSEPLPDGWSGKLWALEQGLARVGTRYALLLDADIALEPGTLRSLLQRRAQEDVSFLSVMASLRMVSFWEKLLMPAFVNFFKMLYPFHLANSPDRRFSAGAGGCILIEIAALRAIGGLESIRGELIDDCALAAKVKQAGYRTWIGLSRDVVSHRSYQGLRPIWEMVARTAYTQLRYSPIYLVLCTLLMATLYWVPILAIAAPARFQLPAIVASAIMFATYLPTLRFYRRNAAWTLAQPVIAALYIAMTWSSALRYWRGERSRWKGRVYQT